MFENEKAPLRGLFRDYARFLRFVAFFFLAVFFAFFFFAIDVIFFMSIKLDLRFARETLQRLFYYCTHARKEMFFEIIMWITFYFLKMNF